MKKAVKKSTTPKAQIPTMNSRQVGQFLVQNASLLRGELVRQLLDTSNRDYDKELGYPSDISPAQYLSMYQREGFGTRVVEVFPLEAWKTVPAVYEDEDQDASTPFEESFTDLVLTHNLWGFLMTADILSGIGRFGVILLGIDDGLPLDQPAVMDLSTKGSPRKLIHLRAFDESVVTIAEKDLDPRSIRYGLPLRYNINFWDEVNGTSVSVTAHWTRVIHLMDGKRSSEIYGTPRQRPVYNRLLDIRKILGGSGEMFWRGAFPGYSFEVNPDQRESTIDAAAMREEFTNYANGLQRYLALTGVSAKSLATQVEGPLEHLDSQINAICITLGIPKRVFLGNEQGELASSQDSRAWNDRVAGRQNRYLSPYVIRPFINRLIQLGVLPMTTESSSGLPLYQIEWPDMNSTTDGEKADIAVKRTNAIAQYVNGNVESVVPRLEFFVHFLGLSEATALALVEAADSDIKDLEDDPMEPVDPSDDEESVKEEPKDAEDPDMQDDDKEFTEDPELQNQDDESV